MAANALASLALFEQYAYEVSTEVIDQQVALFNAASRGAIVLQSGNNESDFSELAKYALIANLVVSRNAYDDSAVSAVDVARLVEISVKCAWGTPPVNIDQHLWTWIQKSPAEAGAFIGQQLAVGVMQRKLNLAISALVAALTSVASTNVFDNTATGVPTLTALNTASGKFGDRSQALVAWIMHSKSVHDLYAGAITGSNYLFKFGDVNIREDGFGRVLVVTDSPALAYVSTGNKYRSLGLVPGAALVVDNAADTRVNTQTSNGRTNIHDTYQAQGSFNLGIKGFKWDVVNGGKSPNDAALAVSTNWDQAATSIKDLAGVMLLST
jgi:hypothetical protein